MDGQAESAPGTGDLKDLVSFLEDTPETESEIEVEPQEAEESTGELPDTDEPANSEQEPTEGDEPDDEPAPAEKITLKVKGDDGAEETVELTTDELAASYMRQKDYTKKTQALAARESEAVETLTKKHAEIREHYINQAEVLRNALIGMAGLKTPDEMAQLAHTDPAAWVAENQRQQSVSAYLQSLDQKIGGERQRAEHEAAQLRNQSLEQQYRKTWEVLEKEKIDKPKLASIYEGVSKTYGFSQEELSNVYDHRLVKMMRDAQAYQALKAQKPDVVRKVSDAARMPNRQTTPSQDKNRQALDRKFKTGTAKLKDLAAYLS